MRIAVLDNDRHQTELVCQVLSAAGHGCQSFSSSRDLMTHARRDSVDLLIIHWHLPEGGAAEVVRWARERISQALPVMFIAGRSNEDDIVAGVAAGADDYMIKPIRRGELVARVQALLRRAYPTQNAVEQIQFGSYVFQSRTGRVTMQGKPIDVTQKEFDLALLFFRNLGRPLSRAYILEAVWARDVQIPSRTMDTHVSRVRSKLQLRPEHGFRLAPVYSYGYRLEQMSSGGLPVAANNASKLKAANGPDGND
jgi:DNA-binding response OmpR family regulator